MNLENYQGPGMALRFGELFLKGRNRRLFEEALYKNVQRVIASRENLKAWRAHGRIFVLGANDADIVARLKNVFGIASISPVYFCSKNIDEIKKMALELADRRPRKTETFRISARRSDKKFPYTSTEIGRIVGAAVVERTGLGVDLEEFDFSVGVEVGPDWTFLWSETFRGAGGLPVGTSGRALLLLSGGIDSPVAGHFMQKRGLSLSAVYFHSFPYTSDGAKEKVFKLARLLRERQDGLTLYVVPFTKLQERFRDGAESKYLVLLYRRAMIRIAEALAEKERIFALITGESLGQVASQTLSNLRAIEDVAKFPVLRPLVGFDKAETISVARQIGSYGVSIEPHDDCCTLFVPKHPETKASIKRLRFAESGVEWQEALREAIEAVEIVEI